MIWTKVRPRWGRGYREDLFLQILDSAGVLEAGLRARQWNLFLQHQQRHPLPLIHLFDHWQAEDTVEEMGLLMEHRQ